MKLSANKPLLVGNLFQILVLSEKTDINEYIEAIEGLFLQI